MRTMIYMLMLAALPTVVGSCQDDSVVYTQKDWNGTTTYFAPTDEMTFDTYYKPYSGYVGDPMPFFDPIAKDFKVMYLQEFRPNQEMTYHPIWAVSTPDGGTYTSLNELIPTGGKDEADAALGTGSVIYNEADKLYYTFYTAHTTKELVMVATSPDFLHWTKSRTFYLNGAEDGYSDNTFRDPFVFKGDDGLFHMIVSTKKGSQNMLAEYTSPDLVEWKDLGTFVNMHWDRFYECPDVFRMGDWWYLIYSDQSVHSRKVSYFKGKTLDELKTNVNNVSFPDNKEGVLNSRAFYAGKTAADGDGNRYIWGWCPTRSGNDNTNVGADPAEPEWAGSLVCLKVNQNADGTLVLAPVKGISKKYTEALPVKVMAQSAEGVTVNGNQYSLTGNSYILFNRLRVHNYISFTVKTSGTDDKFGFSFARGTDSEKYYSLILNPEANNRRKLNFEEEGGIGFVAGIDSYLFDAPADNEYHIQIYTDNSVCTVYVNDKLAYTNRIYGMQKNPWSINCYSGNIEVSDVKVNIY